jgi:hypothetical protein
MATEAETALKRYRGAKSARHRLLTVDCRRRLRLDR